MVSVVMLSNYMKEESICENSDDGAKEDACLMEAN